MANLKTTITIDHPGDWNRHYDTERGQFTYRVTAATTTPDGDELSREQDTVVDTSDNYQEVRCLIDDLLTR